MKTATESISLASLSGHPTSYFRVNERRSLTVHLEDAGMYDVLADQLFNGATTADEVPFVGRYATFAEAFDVVEKLNAIWKAAPNATAKQIVEFVRGKTGGAS